MKRKTDSYDGEDDNGATRTITKRQSHYFIRFRERERFEFVLPQEYAFPANIVLNDDGFTEYTYDDGKQRMQIANRLLKIREALLASASYFDAVCARAGLEQKFAGAPDEPIHVLIGIPTSDSAGAETFFREHRIVFRPNRATSRATVVHEYFHLVQAAVWYRDPEHRKSGINQDKEMWEFFADMTSDWASDEPIAMSGTPNARPGNVDLEQGYLLLNGSHFIRDCNKEFFADTKNRRYEASVLIKYWAEQMVGQEDRSAAEHVLRAYRRVYELGGAKRENFFKALTEPLPEQFAGTSDELRWQNFFRHFCATNVVQNAQLRSDPRDPIGYHDEAFHRNPDGTTNGYDNNLSRTWRTDSPAPPGRVWKIPAQTDEERYERLESLLGNAETIQPLAHRVSLIDLVNLAAPPRPVFVYARGEAGTDLYLLRHKQPDRYSNDRARGEFDLRSEFTFSNQPEGSRPRSLCVVKDVDQRHQGDYLWVGLVNAATELRERGVRWTYLVCPRLRSNSRGRTVWLMGGPGHARRSNGVPVLYPGEDFTLTIHATSPLHVGAAQGEASLSSDEVALGLKILTWNEENQEFEEELPLDERLLNIKCTKFEQVTYWIYEISGKVPDYADFNTPAKFRVRISSPLNLGAPDEQIETCRIELRSTEPFVERFEVQQGDRVVYDSAADVRLPPRSEDGGFRLDVKATFTRDMNPDVTTIKAGDVEPYDRWSIENLSWTGKRTCRGSLTIPADQVSVSGILLRFAVSGETSPAGDAPIGRIDGDYLKPGAQPDTSHYLLLGVDEYWVVFQSCRAKVHVEDIGNNLRTLGERRPTRGTVLMVNHGKDLDGRVNLYLESKQALLTQLDRLIDASEDAIREIKTAQRRASAPERNTPRERLKALRDDLLHERRRLAFMKLRLRPLLEALIRLTSGYRQLAWRPPELCGPMAVEFDGMKVEWKPLINRQATRYGQILAEPWWTTDAEAAGVLRDEFSGGFEHWTFWPSDFEKVRQLMNLSMQYPDYVIEGYDPMADDLRYFLEMSLRSELRQISEQIWHFFPPPSRPSVFNEILELHERQDEWTRLPRPATGHLMLFGGGGNGEGGHLVPTFQVPIQYEGKFFARYKGDRGRGSPDERIVEDEPGKLVTESWSTDGAYVVERQIHRVEEMERWMGLEPPGSHLSLHESPGDRGFAYGREAWTNEFQWSIHDASDRCGLYTSRFGSDRYVYLQPEGDRTHATLRGTIVRWEEGSFRNLDWYTTWGLRRVGDPLPPDPQEPLPEWDSTLGEPPRLTRPGESSPPNSGDEPQPGAESETTAAPGESKADGGPSGKEAPPESDPAKKPPSRAKIVTQASLLDPLTGITTTVRKNPDGSRTITQAEANGKVRGKTTITAKDARRPAVSIRDGETGNTTTVTEHADGSRTYTVTDGQGNVLSEKTVAEDERRRPWASSTDPQTGNTTTSRRLADGSVEITTRDSKGHLIGKPVIRRP